jgi:hypothetical protein
MSTCKGRFCEGAAEGERASGVSQVGGGAGGDQGDELGPAGGVGGDDPVDANAEAVGCDSDVLRGFVHVDDAAVPVEQDGGGFAGVEHGFGVAGAVLGQAEGVADPEGVLQMRHQQGQQFLVLFLQHGSLRSAPQADDFERAGGYGEDQAGGVLHSSGGGEVAIDLGFDELVVGNNVLALDDADAGIAQEGLAEGVGILVGGLERLLEASGNGHASGGEGAVAQGAVVAQEEANARAGDLAQLVRKICHCGSSSGAAYKVARSSE